MSEEVINCTEPRCSGRMVYHVSVSGTKMRVCNCCGKIALLEGDSTEVLMLSRTWNEQELRRLVREEVRKFAEIHFVGKRG